MSCILPEQGQNTMRRTIFMGIALAAGLLMAGCNGSTTTDSASQPSANGSGKTDGKPVTIGIVFDTGGLGDKSFNDSAWRGVQKCESELGAKYFKVESAKESDYAGNLQAMADKGSDIVIGVGISMAKAIEQVAPNNPKTMFVSIDGEDLKMPNVRTIQFTEQEGSFLVGYVAGLTTKTGKLGFVGGMELPLIKKFQYGYAAGAKTANKAVEVLPAKYTGDWVNQDKAKVAAEFLFGSGADIVYHAAGRAGLGVLTAAKEKNLYAIGVDSDQDDIEPGHVLTSMIKHVDEGVFLTVKDLKDGKFTPGPVVYDLKVGGVGTSDFAHTKDIVGADNLKKLDDIKAKIIAGEIVVPSDEASYNSYLATLK